MVEGDIILGGEEVTTDKILLMSEMLAENLDSISAVGLIF